MIKYYRQVDTYSCGPIAILNAVKWAGFDNFDDEDFLKQIRIVTKCKTQGGVTNKNLDVGVRSRPELQIMKRMDSPGMIDVRKAIDKGYGIILVHKNKHSWIKGHVVFIASRCENNYLIANQSHEFGKQSAETITSVVLSKLMRAGNKSRRFKPTAIFVRRNPNA